MTASVFADLEPANYPHRWNATILVHTLAGGTPADPAVAERFITTKLADKNDLIRNEVATIMVDQSKSIADAATEAAELRHLVGFPRDEHGLYFEGRKIMACLKEAVSIAVSEQRIALKGFCSGNKAKHTTNAFAEHVFVVEDRIPLGCEAPSGVAQSFPRSRFGTSIQLTEYVQDAKIDFTVISDREFTREEWGAIWLTAEKNGIGASRSQGYGTFKVVKWEQA